MTMKSLSKNGKLSLLVILLATLHGSISWAADNTKKPPPQVKAAPPPKPANAPRPPQRPVGGPVAPHGPTIGSPNSRQPSTSPTTDQHPMANAGGRPASTTTNNNTERLPGRSPNAASAKTAFYSQPPRGTSEHVAKNGAVVRTRESGKLSDIHDARRNMDIHHGLDGSRRVSVVRGDGSRLVAERGRRGYVERGYNYRGHDFARRSYYYNGRQYDRYYRGYPYRGVYLNVYAPAYYYAPGFYGWAYNPWVSPISYSWGWGASPWYGYYGGYFTPFAVYPSANFWLTDYIISQDLQAAYAAQQQEAAAGDANAAAVAAMGPEVKQMIADEVKAQLALENSEAGQSAQQQDVAPDSSGIARMLADGRKHVFVVGGGLDLTDATGQECSVSEGDVLELASPSPDQATSANLVVLASKGGRECQRTSTVAVELTDLQEMQNHMRETIDQGLQDLQAKQGKGGLPQAPPSAQAKPTESQYAEIAPPPVPADAAAIQEQVQQADKAETEVSADAGH